MLLITLFYMYITSMKCYRKRTQILKRKFDELANDKISSTCYLKHRSNYNQNLIQNTKLIQFNINLNRQDPNFKKKF